MTINIRIANRQHRWLSSVEVTGVVLSEPVLADAGNFRSLDKAEIAAFRKQREIWNLPKGMVEGNGQPGWINFILEDFLGLKDKGYWQLGAAIPVDSAVNLLEQQEVLRPTRVLIDDGNAVMLVLEVPREQSLDKPWLQEKGRWKASPTTKFERLLRETGIELGLLTNGEAWRLVVASPSETTSWMTWTVQTWNDDPITLAAFKDLLGESRFFAGPRNQVILELIKQSRQRQLDVADQLGNQVREALQILVHELDRTDVELDGQYLKNYSEAEVFESSVAFIMRLLFTLYAEENGLLPHGNVTYDRSYGILHLLTELEETRRLAPEKLKHSYAAYARLLASARLLHDGSVDPDIRIAAHGGQLFDPDRYPLLDGRAKNGEWPTEVPEPPKVRDAVIRDILRSLKYAKADGVRQLVSYRTLAVEQIGHMYEGLLDRRVARAPADQTLLLLQGGPKINEPEPVHASEFFSLDEAALINAISHYTSKTVGSIKKVLERNEERQTLVNLGSDDAQLLEQAKPVERFLQPFGIVRPSGLYVTHGQDRRSSGAHYTPPTLTEPLVRRTLEHQVYVNVEDKPGLLVEPRLIKTPQEILALKVCDPAMGSGAFLVQATRYLAERLVDAWERMAAEQPDSILTMPFGTQSQGKASENLMPDSREERIVFARRYVAEYCIYGVDINKLAVEMAKLSLWLTTLSNDRPFTFLDHSLKHGNSLVGLTPEQIRNFTWKPTSNDFGPLFANQSDLEVEEAEKHREAIHNIADHDFVSKEKENRIAEAALTSSRMKATLAIAAFFDGANTKQREAKLIEYRYWLERLGKDEKALDEVGKIIHRLTASDKSIIPFCWEVEFPEVFHRANKGFDALIGNPPFLWGQRISTYFGEKYFEYLRANFSHVQGVADLVVYFFAQMHTHLRTGGSFGIISTDTIRQGDSRESSLAHCESKNLVIYDAIPSTPWPGKATVQISRICISKGSYYGQKLISDVPCTRIDSRLSNLEDNNHKDPVKIKNPLLNSYVGSYTYGDGFLLTEEQKNEIIRLEPNCEKVIQMYLIGDDVLSHPKCSPSRWVINFGNMTEEEASYYKACYGIVREKVYPERQQQKRETRRKFWWQYAEKANNLYKSLEGLSNIIVHPYVSTHLNFELVPANYIYASPMVVIVSDKIEHFALLQNNFHKIWITKFCSTLGKGIRYTTSDGLSKFPFPKKVDSRELQSLGLELLTLRSKYKSQHNIGLTGFGNRLANPNIQDEIEDIRKIMKRIDHTILRMYGWQDISLEYGVEVGEFMNWTPKVQEEILKRLINLNLEITRDN